MVVPENDVFPSKRPRTQSEYCLRKINENDKETMIAEICSQPDAPIDPQKFIRIGIGKEFKIILFAKLFGCFVLISLLRFASFGAIFNCNIFGVFYCA